MVPLGSKSILIYFANPDVKIFVQQNLQDPGTYSVSATKKTATTTTHRISFSGPDMFCTKWEIHHKRFNKQPAKALP